MCFSLRPADRRTHARQIHEKSPPDDDTKWDRSPLRSLPSTALRCRSAENRRPSPRPFPRPRPLARSLARRAAGRRTEAGARCRAIYVCYERDSHEDRHVMRLNELSSDLLCEALGKGIIERIRGTEKGSRARCEDRTQRRSNRITNTRDSGKPLKV